MTIDQPAPAQPAPFVVSIGNIHATQHHVVTPSGSWPITDVNVTTADQTHTTTHTPAWAIVLCVVLVWFFLLSLLFLLAKETRTAGYVAVVVQSRGGQSYVENVPVHSAVQRADVFNRVTFLQSLIGQERWRLGG